MTLEQCISDCEQVMFGAQIMKQTEVYEYNRQLAEWLKELKWYREQIQNLINNESFEVVNPFNTYEYMRVVRVADLYDLIEVNTDEDYKEN